MLGNGIAGWLGLAATFLLVGIVSFSRVNGLTQHEPAPSGPPAPRTMVTATGVAHGEENRIVSPTGSAVKPAEAISPSRAQESHWLEMLATWPLPIAFQVFPRPNTIAGDGLSIGLTDFRNAAPLALHSR